MNQEQPIWKYAFASIVVTISTLGFGRMSYGILMPFMKESLSLTYEQVGMLATTNSIGYLGMVLFAGILAAKWGSKKLVVFGTLLVSVGLLYLATVQTYGQSRGDDYTWSWNSLHVHAAREYCRWLVSTAAGNDALVSLASGLGLGTLISSIFIPFFTTWFSIDGWRYLWFVYGLLSLLFTLAALLILRDPPIPLLKKEEQGPISMAGSVYP